MTATETPSAPSAPVSSQIHLSTTVEYEQVSCNDAKDLYVMASLVAPSTETEERQTRAPIDIVACIDVSGSMAGEKLKLVRASLEFMVDQLKDEDSLCLVLFDDKVETRLQMTKMTKSGRQTATDIIKGIRDGGSTNLSGAIFQGFEEIKRRTNPRDVATILLFTDGLANVGITDSKSIVAGAEKYLQNIGKAVSLFTFGFGSDHDPNMLRAIAESGNGLYYYLQREDEIPQSFADCLGGLLSVAAQNIRLKIETLDNGIALKTVHSAYKKVTETATCVELSIGDLYSEESKDIVLEVTLNQLRSELDRQDLVKFTLSYYNVKELNSETLEVNATVNRPTQAPSDQKPNPELQKQRHRVDTANALQRGRELADSGRLQEAKQVLVDTKQLLAQSDSCDDFYTTNLMGDLDRVSEGMNSTSSYASYGNKMACSAWSENHRQRSNKPISMFKTKQKKSMEEKYESEYKK